MTRFFDITDLVRFARASGTVSGIQRVQVRVLRHLADRCDPEDAICLYAAGRLSRLRACRARDLFVDETYDAGQLLAKLGLENPAAPFTKRELYDFLARYPKGSLRRAAKKVELTALARVAPARARFRMGLPAQPFEQNADGQRIETWPVRRIQADDHLVMIGTNWNVSEIEAVAKRHGRRGGSVTQVVYDLIPYRHPEYCIDSLSRKFSGFLARSRVFTSHYICISAATQRDLQAYLAEHGSVAPVDAWPLAHEFEGYRRNDRATPPSDPEVARQTKRPFVLCVGTIEVRKNGIALLRAWQKLIQELGDAVPLLVFAGKYGWKIEPFRDLLAADEALQRRVRVFTRPTDADLASLYQRCLFTAYPSLVEGWGLPVGEAAWFGKYSVVSSSSSLPEVCGDLVDYVAPTDLDGLVQAVYRAVIDDDYRRRREQAIAQASLRSWRDVADHFDRLLHGKTAVSPDRKRC
jgi:glycosyltransferase involved in cell wall biosynthesis